MATPTTAPVNLSDRERRALLGMADTSEDGNYKGFQAIGADAGLELKHVRRSVRALARKGLAVYGRGLWNDEGPAGAGYALTKAGREAVDAL